jgi:hypothetical protein
MSRRVARRVAGSAPSCATRPRERRQRADPGQGKDLQDRRRLPVAANGQKDPFFAPFHGRTIGAPPRLVHAMGPWQGPRHVSGPVPCRPIAGPRHRRALRRIGGRAMGLPDGPARDRAARTVVEMARFFTILTTGSGGDRVLVTVAISKTRGLSAPTLAALTLSVVMTGLGLSRYAGGGLEPHRPRHRRGSRACTRSSRAFTSFWWLVHAPKTSLIWADLPAFALWPAVYMAYALGLATLRRSLSLSVHGSRFAAACGGSRSRSASSAS